MQELFKQMKFKKNFFKKKQTKAEDLIFCEHL